MNYTLLLCSTPARLPFMKQWPWKWSDRGGLIIKMAANMSPVGLGWKKICFNYQCPIKYWGSSTIVGGFRVSQGPPYELIREFALVDLMSRCLHPLLCCYRSQCKNAGIFHPVNLKFVLWTIKCQSSFNNMNLGIDCKTGSWCHAAAAGITSWFKATACRSLPEQWPRYGHILMCQSHQWLSL